MVCVTWRSLEQHINSRQSAIHPLEGLHRQGGGGGGGGGGGARAGARGAGGRQVRSAGGGLVLKSEKT